LSVSTILSPSGALIYPFGGYRIIFVILGALFFFVGTLARIILPKPNENVPFIQTAHVKGWLDLIHVPLVSLAAYGALCASVSVGFLQATLEPHLRTLHLTKLTTGKSHFVQKKAINQSKYIYLR